MWVDIFLESLSFHSENRDSSVNLDLGQIFWNLGVVISDNDFSNSFSLVYFKLQLQQDGDHGKPAATGTDHLKQKSLFLRSWSSEI
ncbi:hypothetical protein C0J52_13006 [Blattella germanica]|nr:hypothetical protein C0J52_13006 [Blattella germanica]